MDYLNINVCTLFSQTQRYCALNRLQYSVSITVIYMYQETKAFMWLTLLLYFSDLNPNPQYLWGVPVFWSVIIYHSLPDGIWNFFQTALNIGCYFALYCNASSSQRFPPYWHRIHYCESEKTKENTFFGSSKAGLDPKKLIFQGKKKLRRMGIHFREIQNLIRFYTLFKEILHILSSNNKSTLWEYK